MRTISSTKEWKFVLGEGRGIKKKNHHAEEKKKKRLTQEAYVVLIVQVLNPWDWLRSVFGRKPLSHWNMQPDKQVSAGWGLGPCWIVDTLPTVPFKGNACFCLPGALGHTKWIWLLGEKGVGDWIAKVSPQGCFLPTLL